MNVSSSSLVLRTLKLKDPKLVSIESCSSIFQLKSIHAYMIRSNTIFDLFSASRLVSFCVDKKFLDYALRVFRQIENPNLFIYNALIRGFSRSKNPDESFHFYMESQRRGIFPDNITFPFLVMACTKLGCLGMGIQAHGHVIRRGFEDDVYVENSLMHMYSTIGDVNSASYIFQRMVDLDVVSWTTMIAGYCQAGDVESARELFDKMPERNLVTWSSMINGYVRNEFFDKAIELFDILQSERIRANEVVMVGVISSCARLGALEIGDRAYEYMVRNGIKVNKILGTALVDMYARCGCIDRAISVFEELPERDALSWTALISGFAMHGFAEKALKYFSKMVMSGNDPMSVTFTAVLSACRHGGLVKEGLELFERMRRDYGIEPTLEHYGCVVDLLGRAGKLDQAEKFVHEMPVQPNAPIWGALLGACRIHKNAEIAERVGKVLIELQPEHSGYYVLLSNIYSRTNRWENAENMRLMMKERGVRKSPGYTVIEIDKKVHKFTIGDNTHPEMDKIGRMWEEILQNIRLAGYTGNTADALFDVEEEEKESAIYRHSEKLAIAFGIMRTKARTTIRIVKNLRVCEDCHIATKIISKVYDRELIVRDRNRFHHFKEGSCSCMDYW